MNIEDIISKYLNKLATKEEAGWLLAWLKDKDENVLKFRGLYDCWLHENAKLTDDMEVEAAFVRLKKRTLQKEKRRLAVPYLYLIRIASVVLLLFSIGYIGYRLGDRGEQKIITMNHLLTGPDGKGEYLLPDGSTVWLNANSLLRYPESFTGEKRTVYLEGEALFDIKKDKKKPFFVETDGLNIEVVGTCFLLKNYPQKNSIETVLVDGSVEISGDYFEEARMLKPGELIVYNKQTKQADLYQVNTDDYTNWIHSKLVFDKTNLAQVIINLEKWFDVEIIASPELIRNTHMSFTIRRESLEEVLTYMSLTASIDYKWEDDVLHLSPKK